MEIKYKNKLGNEIVLSSNPSSLRLYQVVGLDGLTNNIYTSKSPRQDGTTIDNTDLQDRPISIQGKIITTNREEMQRRRNELLKAFNLKCGGVLCYKGLYINCEVHTAPIFKYTSHNILEWVVELIGPNPYLETLELGEEINTWINGLKFKFSLPFKMKQRGPAMKNIINDGHVETPVKIYFKGPAVNPTIYNRTTGEFIRVIRELGTDDTLIINTEFGNKTVEIDVRGGNITNAFNYIDLDSTFFNLQVGDNLIEYTSDNKLVPNGVAIRYKNRYLGI